ncbi:hypothetical protein ACFSN5_07735 [Streptococcus tangpeifui]|uniref:hypothetical protein n=1 Tax=Streptococcus tangpeifui TaxID=2709400 RepID=UPI0013EACBDF|nr:hypothetical protein [Streptococcus sp. ZJ1593]
MNTLKNHKRMIKNCFNTMLSWSINFLNGLRNNILTLLFSISLGGGLSLELSVLLRKLNLNHMKTLIFTLPFNSVELSTIIVAPVLLIIAFLKLPKIKKRFKVSIVSLSMILVVFGIYTIIYLNNTEHNKISVGNSLSILLIYLCFKIIYIIIELLLYLYKRMYDWLLDTNSTVEPAKLTLIWTIIAFILGIFISKK